jgi:hypothetical protein
MRKIIMLVILCMTLTLRSQNKITGMEYWFDQQHGSRQFLPLTATNEYLNTLKNLTVGNVQPGYHMLNLRMRDPEGLWSSVISHRVYIHPASENKISKLRIWSDPSSHPSDLFTVPITPNVKYLYISKVLDLCQLDNSGPTRVFFQLGDNNGNWSSVVSRLINVDVIGQPPATIADIIGPEFICYNFNQNYSAISVGASSYQWNASPSWYPITNFDTLSLIPDHENGIIEVYASNACGNSNVVTLAVSVNDSFPLIPLITDGPSNVCAGSEYDYTVASDTDVNEYTWEFPPDWTVQSILSDNKRTVKAGITSGEITIIASNACGDSQVSMEVSVTPHIPINQNPIIGSPYGCTDSVLTVSIQESSITDVYHWEYPTDWESFDTTNNHVLEVTPTSTSGSINISLQNICGISDTLSFFVEISDSSPTLADSIQGALSLCYGDTIALSVETSGDVQSYAWQFPSDWEVLSNMDSNLVNVIVGQSEETISVIAENACGASNSSTFNPNVTHIDTGLLRNGDTLMAIFPNAIYQWINCLDSSDIAGATFQTFLPQSSGLYAVRIAQNGCIATSGCNDVILTNLKDEDYRLLDLVFPNPFHDKLFIRRIYQSHDKITILDVLGKQAKFTITRQEEGMEINMSADSPPGMYLIILQTSESIKIISVVKS